MAKNKLPAIQFYVGDWRKDPGVQALDYETRGVWVEILCLMHESSDRGRLVLPDGRPFPDEGIARNLGLDLFAWQAKRRLLIDYGVASEKDGVLYNRRMVKDERLRDLRAAAGRKGGVATQKQRQSKTKAKEAAKRSPSVSVSVSVSPSSNKELTEEVVETTSPNGRPGMGENFALETDGAPTEKPETWMHRIWNEVLGSEGRPLRLTADRSQKYRAMYREQLADTPDPETAWRAVLFAVTRSEHHMATRNYQLPESLLLNESRRDKWVEATREALESPGNAKDRKLRHRSQELAEHLKSRSVL